MGPAQQALLEGELSVFDTYETEYDLMRQPVLTWDAESNKVEIPPGKMMTVAIGCFGKAGWCELPITFRKHRSNKTYSTNGSIHMSYACSRHALDARPPVDNFYARQLTYPVLVTVYHMLECYDMDILSYSGLNDRVGSDCPAPSLGESEDQNWCLFSIEVRNTYGLPFEVAFERIDEGQELTTSLGPGCVKSLPDNVVASTCHTVPPGSTRRCVIDPPISGNSGSRIVPKDNFTAAKVGVDRRTDVQGNTVVVRASVCCGQVQVVIRRH